MKAAVLFSGGMDSTTVLYQAIADGAKEVLAVTFNYGSKHADREIAAAEMIMIGVMSVVRMQHVVLTLPDIFGGGKSAVMGDVDMPQGEYNR